MLISSSYMLHIWLIMGFHSHGGTPIAGWLGKIHENPIRMDDLGYPHLWKHPYGLHYWILMYTVRIYYGFYTFFMFQFVCLSMYLFICMWMCVCVCQYIPCTCRTGTVYPMITTFFKIRAVNRWKHRIYSYLALDIPECISGCRQHNDMYIIHIK